MEIPANVITPDQIELAAKFGSAIGAIAGGTIVGFVTLFVSYLTRKHEIRREQFKRKQEIVERLSGDFEEVHAIVVRLYSQYSAFLQLTGKAESLATASLNKAVEIVNVEVAGKLSLLHSIAGRLKLLGYASIEKSLANYCDALIAMQNAPSGLKVVGSAEEWLKIYNETRAIRDAIYSDLRREYTKA